MKRHTTMHDCQPRLSFAAIAMLCFMLFAGCGDDSEDPQKTPDSPPPSTPAPVPRID